MRLVRELEYITFDEFKIFAVQMTDYHKFDSIRDSILRFREEKSQNRGQYKRFVNDIWENAILEIHKDRIAAGKREQERLTMRASKNLLLRKKAI